ncbi:MAG: FtsX-like permease family protein [Bacteroidaceae bacterium]|nr:FtsX-like permease family protein [Bacteroidaceae bacterium]
MNTKYFKQIWAHLRQDPVVSIISVLGTALSIFLIMLVVMLQQVKVAPFSPESNRSRILYAQYISISNKKWGDGSSNGPMDVKIAKELYKSLKTPEAVTIYSVCTIPAVISIPNSGTITTDALLTDADFWHVFDFRFIKGKPYDQVSFDAAIPSIVMAESMARQLFGNIDIIGKNVEFNYTSYRIVGIVKDVSTLASTAYAQVWVPYTTTSYINNIWCEVGGSFSTAILARSRKDFSAIRTECNQQLAISNKKLSEKGYKILSRNRPYDQEKKTITYGANIEPDINADHRQKIIIFIILLLVPAINLSSMTQSRLRRRIAEIGIRRAFGSTRSKLLKNIITESFIVSLLAGIIGLIFCFAFAYLGTDILFAQPYQSTFCQPTIDTSILMQPATFLYALGFCFVLNLLSSLIPAWRASRINIVNALNGKIK